MGSGSREQEGSLTIVAMKREEQSGLVMSLQHQAPQRPLCSARPESASARTLDLSCNCCSARTGDSGQTDQRELSLVLRIG